MPARAIPYSLFTLCPQTEIVVLLLKPRQPRHRAIEDVIDQAAGRVTGDSKAEKRYVLALR